MNSRWVAVLCIGLMLAVSAVTYSQLPARVPIHWGLDGRVDGYAPPWLAAVLLPAMAAVITASFRVLPSHDPLPRHSINERVMSRYGNWVVLFLLVLHAGTLGNAVGLQFDLMRVVMIAVGALFVALGNEMGRLRPNSWAGIRAPWTLNDEDVWRRSNRAGGRIMVLSGLLTLLFAIVLPINVMFWAGMTAVLGGVIFMVGYSYHLARQKRKSVLN